MAAPVLVHGWARPWDEEPARVGRLCKMSGHGAAACY